MNEIEMVVAEGVEQSKAAESKPVTKVQLAAELAELTGISKAKAFKMLDGLAYICYREATRGFVIPGVCKVDVVHRKERTCRNPRTGQMYRIGERDVVRIRPVKKAKDLITPAPDGLLTAIETPQPAEPSPEEAVTQPPAAATPAPAPAPAPVPAEPEVAFACKGCGVEILAPVSSAGQSATCPACGQLLTIPLASSTPVASPAVPAATRHEPAAPSASGATPAHVSENVILFSCPECKQDIEAPGSSAGSRGECPSCGAELTVPRQSMKGVARAALPGVIAATRKSDIKSLMSQTIRIDLP